MTQSAGPWSMVVATAQEVLPRFGLAYVVGDDDKSWAVTRSTPGPGLESLRQGQRLQLTLDHHDSFTVVRHYEPLS